MCKKEVNISSYKEVDGKYVTLCLECSKKHHYEIIERNLEAVEKPYHFKEWDHGDMSDAFWLHLGIYKKRPNKKSLSVMKNAWYWACHASHGLSSSFTHALKWCGIDLFTELERTDLPEV
jgi:hypothetical protein